MTQEQENFYRYSTVIVDETKDSFLYMLDFYLINQGKALQRFIEINAHNIYHLCFNRYPCCQCPPGTRSETRGSRILHPPQLDILFDKTGNKLLRHNPGSKSAPHCCCRVNPNLQLQDLDFTLARLLLVNFTTLVPQGSPERNALDFLVNSRNQAFAHAKEGKMSKSEYQKYMAEIEKYLLVLAKIYKRETETKQRLSDIAKQPLNSAICLQLQITLLQQCQIDESIKQLLAEKVLPDCLTKDICDVTVIEGWDAHFEIWTKECELCSLWLRDEVEIERCEKFIPNNYGLIHSLDIINASLFDKGLYTVRVKDIERQARLEILAYFTKNLRSVELIEGETAEFTCEVIENSLPACWSKNGINLENGRKYEILQAGKIQKLYIKNCDQHDTAKYTVSINNRVREASLVVKAYFTKNPRSVELIEGETAEFTCEVIENSLPACWSKNGINLENGRKYEILQAGKIHKLHIKNCDQHDTAKYTVSINNRVREASLVVKEYFTKSLATLTCIEGEHVHFECEVLEDNQTALWFKDGTELSTSIRYQVERHRKLHTLVVNNARLDDQGEYLVKIKNCVRSSKLIVQAIPAAIRQLSDKDKDLYLEIIQSGIETRFYIRVVIIGENGVGKTCLLRRILGKSIEDVESTDGIDVHRCKIRQHDGQWVVDEVGNLKRDMMTRIKKAVLENAKTSDVLPIITETHSALPANAMTHVAVNNEQVDYSQSSNTGPYAHTQSQPGARKMNQPNKVMRKSKSNQMGNEGIYDSKRGNSDALTLPEDEFKRSLSESIQIQKLEKKIEPRLGKILTEAILNELSQFIDDIEKYKNSDDILVDCAIWDFAGQKHYYPTHPIFLNPNAVYLLVADIMKDIKEINTETGYDKIGEYIDFWLDSIYSCGAKDATIKSTEDKLNPPVIVVCTGIDKCKDQLHERKEKFRKQLLSMMHNEDKQKHLRRISHVSNTEPLDKDFDDLRKSIFEFGKNIESYGKKLPLRWIRLEQALDIVRGAGVNLLSWPDMTDLAFKCSIEDKLEVSLFLKYHHQVGSIIYFESLKEHIILNPKWLADAFRCFVSDKYDDDLKLTPEWKTLEDTGELKPSLIIKLFHKEPEREFYKQRELLLKVMEMFGVIVKLESCMDDGQTQRIGTYFMPCMISEKTSIVEICNVFGVKRDSCTQTPWLCIQFDFMPFDFFNHIVCHYIRKYSVCSDASSRRMALYHGMGVFFLDNTKSRKFILCFSKNTIAMQIWQWRKLEQGACKSMLEELRSVIHTVKDKYEPRRISYYEKAKCAHGNIHVTSGRYSYKELADFRDEEFFCEEHNEMHDTRYFFQTWFEEYSEDTMQYPMNENYKTPSVEVKVEEDNTDHAVTNTPAPPSRPTFTIQKFSYDDKEFIDTKMQNENEIKRVIQDDRFKQRCNVCDDKGQSVYYCYDCCQSLCEHCNDLHSRVRNTREHLIQYVHDMYSPDYELKIEGNYIRDIKMLHDDVLVIADGTQLVTCDLAGQLQHVILLHGEPHRIAVVDNNTALH